MLTTRWWEKAEDDSCSATAKTSQLGPEQLSGIFLLLAIAMVLAIVACVVQLVAVFIKGHKRVLR